MAKNRTKDGVRISRVRKSLETIPGVQIRDGKDQRLVVSRVGYDRVCQVSPETNIRTSLVSWFRYATGTERKADEIYDLLKTGGRYATVP